MERGRGEAGAPAAAEAGAAPAKAVGEVVRGKSCKGCLYFSSVLRSRSRGPVCVGITRSIPEGRVYLSSASSHSHSNQSTASSFSSWARVSADSTNTVPERMIGEIELEAIREGRNLSDFKYACVGYSIYLDDKENPVGVKEKQVRAQLPICVGVELLADRRGVRNKESSPYLKKDAPQPHRYKPGQAGDGFLTKFQRNAGLVANGVAKNLNKVGNYIKDTVGDITHPYRKRSK